MNTFKIIYSNGDHMTTGFNGTIEEAKAYYLNNIFNIGRVEDKIVKVISVKQL